MRLFANANYDFIGNRRIAYAITGAVLTLFFVAAIVFQFSRGSWLNYGVDFTGGTLVQVRFEQATSVNDLREILAGTEITRFGGENEFLIRAPVYEEGTDAAAPVVAALGEAFGQGTFEVVRTEAVGAKIGGELQQRALMAILVSFLFTLIYLAFRFEWRFGAAAVIATAHDILLTLGLISVLQREVSLPTVAAVLTIVGYSLNDTIVIFDRIRENLAGAGRREPFITVLNRSINETLPRTVLTTATTLATLLALFLFGGAVIRDFALILIVGIVLGTYSSIFVAAPALLEIEKRWPAERKKAKIAKVRAAT